MSDSSGKIRSLDAPSLVPSRSSARILKIPGLRGASLFEKTTLFWSNCSVPANHHFPNAPMNQVPASVTSPFSVADGESRHDLETKGIRSDSASDMMGTAARVKSPKLRKTCAGVRKFTDARLAKWKPETESREPWPTNLLSIAVMDLYGCLVG